MSLKVSIIIPVYNREAYVARAIRSCLDQSLSDKEYEIIVINDGSEDNSHEEICKFSERIQYIKFDKNKGLPFARNLGIRQSTARYIINVDSDDFIHPKTLEFMLLAIELNSDYDAVACDYVYTDLGDRRSAPISSHKFPIACGILFKRQILIELGLYDENLRIHEEKDLLLRFKKKHEMLNIPIPLYRYLQHDQNISNSSEADHFMNILQKKHKQ